MPNPACPDCGYRFTRCMDKAEVTPEFYCKNCGCYFCEGEDASAREPIILSGEIDPLTE
jgi:hypothetical protein